MLSIEELREVRRKKKTNEGGEANLYSALANL